VTTSHALAAFLIASGLLTVTPGLDTALVLRTAALGGRQRAIAASLGICLGLITWGFSASIGLGMLLKASRLAYNLFRVAGAGYLIFLGCKMLAHSRLSHAQNANQDFDLAGKSAAMGSPREWFARGVLTNLLNPKVGIFYVTFLPQFIPAGVKVVGFSMLLAGIHAIEGALWFGILIAAAGRVSTWMQQDRAAKILDRITGTVFVGFGLSLLFEDRH
jgi:threonine/homoserine/homoserine lactone efflux protein